MQKYHILSLSLSLFLWLHNNPCTYTNVSIYKNIHSPHIFIHYYGYYLQAQDYWNWQKKVAKVFNWFNWQKKKNKKRISFIDKISIDNWPLTHVILFLSANETKLALREADKQILLYHKKKKEKRTKQTKIDKP